MRYLLGCSTHDEIHLLDDKPDYRMIVSTPNFGNGSYDNNVDITWNFMTTSSNRHIVVDILDFQVLCVFLHC